MSVYPSHFSLRQTPQTEPAPNKAMVPNSAGGFGFAVDDWARLDRFLILGSEGGSYYATERALTVANAQCVVRCLDSDPERTVGRIVAISESGRAPKNDPAIFALAIAAGHAKGKQAALAALPKVCRIGTHLFAFAEAVQSMRGWGRSLRRAFSRWYTAQGSGKVAYQCIKYQSRNKWSHRDIMRLCHLNRDTFDKSTLRDIYQWVTKGWEGIGEEEHPNKDMLLIWAFERAKRATDAREIARLIRDYGLVRECVPTQFLTDAGVWDALLDKMPLTAMVRNLATMTRVGLLAPLSAAVGKVCRELADVERIKKARLHPVALLMALKTYAQGRGERSQNTWTPVAQVIDALDGAFYLAFQAVEPTGKRWLIGVDVSGSMSSACAGTPLSCCEGAAAMAMVTAHTEAQYHVMGFADTFRTLPITKKSRLDDAVRCARMANFGRTDCSLPMLWALQNKVPVDVFSVVTDNETYAGAMHPFQAINEYRQRTGIPAKLIVTGMTSSGFTIADPSDAGMIDIVGFDANAPAIMADFARQ